MTVAAADAFTAAMAAFAPWEAAPRLGLAVSGGADSTALAILAARWTAEQGGEAVALVVDHGLRPASADEAVLVAARCRALGLGVEVLTVGESAPDSSVEAWARRRRYALLEDACRRRGVLHLLTAHHADDQSETVALRRERGSGAAGLAGMSACVERRHLRLLRPLLAAPKGSLVACCVAAGLTWVEDAMNRDTRFARARLRRGGSIAPAAPTGHERVRMETGLCHRLPAVAAIDRFGVGRLDVDGWRGLDRALRRAVLARLALAVGGAEHAPSAAALDHLADRIADGGASATLGRCLWHRGGSVWRVERESRALPLPVALAPGQELSWDGRFELLAERAGLVVAPLGRSAPPACVAARRSLGLSAAAAAALPAFLDLEGVLAVPHLGYARRPRDHVATARCRPRHSLAPVPFAIVRGGFAGNQLDRGASATA